MCVGSSGYLCLCSLFICEWASSLSLSLSPSLSLSLSLSLPLSLSLSLSVSLFSLSLYPSILRAEADRADVDNYKVFSQRANFGDVCLRLPLSLSFVLIVLFVLPSSSSSLSCGSVASQGTTTPQTLSTIFTKAPCVRPVCVFVIFLLFFFSLVYFSCLFDCSSVDTYLSAILLFQLPSSLFPHMVTFQQHKPMFCSVFFFFLPPCFTRNIWHFLTLTRGTWPQCLVSSHHWTSARWRLARWSVCKSVFMSARR